MIEPREKKRRESTPRDFVDPRLPPLIDYRNLRLKLLSTVNSTPDANVFQMIPFTEFHGRLFLADFNYRKMIAGLHLRQEALNSLRVQ